MLHTHLPPPSPPNPNPTTPPSPGWMTSNSAGKSQGWRQNCRNLSLYQVSWVTFSFDYFHFFLFMGDHRMKTSSSCGMVQHKLQNNSTTVLDIKHILPICPQKCCLSPCMNNYIPQFVMSHLECSSINTFVFFILPVKSFSTAPPKLSYDMSLIWDGWLSGLPTVITPQYHWCVDNEKSMEDRDKEEELLQQVNKLVETRDFLVDDVKFERLRYVSSKNNNLHNFKG